MSDRLTLADEYGNELEVDLAPDEDGDLRIIITDTNAVTHERVFLTREQARKLIRTLDDAFPPLASAKPLGIPPLNGGISATSRT